jgi:hypothetical protein
MNSVIATLKTLIDEAEHLGLPEVDLKHAIEFLEHHEYGLCFDQLVTQLYEFEILISEGFYRHVDEAAKQMHLPTESYIFIAQLINKALLFDFIYVVSILITKYLPVSNIQS